MESVKKTSGEADALAQFIEDKFLVSFSDGTLSYDSDLFENGVIDSFGVIEIVKSQGGGHHLHICARVAGNSFYFPAMPMGG